MIRSPWKTGPVSPESGPVVVSATRFLYRRWRYMPRVWLNGWRLRRRWGARQGGVGLFTAVEGRRPVTYSMSVWATEDELRRFLRAPEHVKLMREFKSRLTASTSVVWEMEEFTPEAAWRQGMQRLAAKAATA
jgi:hypothetical protein